MPIPCRETKYLEWINNSGKRITSYMVVDAKYQMELNFQRLCELIRDKLAGGLLEE